MPSNPSEPSPAPIDPYLRWALESGADGLFGGVARGAERALPLLVERGSRPWAALRGTSGVLHAPEANDPTPFGAVWLAAEALAGFVQVGWRCELSQPLPGGQAPRLAAARDAPDASWRDARVVVGLIDWGGAPLHRGLACPDAPQRSRLLAYWDQAQEAAPDDADWKPARAGYGRCLDTSAIQHLFAACKSPGDEWRSYRRLGLHGLCLKAERGEVDHGSFLADTLTGRPDGRAPGAAAKPGQSDEAARAPLVMVSLPPPPALARTRAPAGVQLLDALRFVVQTAARHAPDARVVVNLSLALLAGPPDGSLLLVRAIDALMNEHPQLLVLVSAGNVPPFLQSAGGVLEAGAVSSLGWRVQPDDPTDNHLELLVYGGGALPAEAESALDITLHGPGAGGSHRLAGSGQLRIGDHEQLLGLLSCEPAQALSDTERARLRSRLGEPLRWRQRLLLSLAAAQPGRLQPAGAWTLALRVAAQRVQLLAQVQGDASPWPGRVAQSALQAEALGPGLRPEATRNVLASGEGPWVVTASRLSDGRPSPYSPPHDRTRAVALRAAADEGQFVLGLHAAGVLSGSLVRMNGTSVASAVAARVWVNLAVRLPPGLKDWRRAFVEAARHAKRGPGDDLDLSLRPGDVAGQAPWLQSR